MLNKQKLLITGATGFIGSCLLRELLSRDEKVAILLRKNANTWRINDILHKTTVYQSDLSDYAELSRLIKDIKPTVIYHLAAYGAYPAQNNPDLCISTNITGTLNLLRATCDIDYELFVNTGSSSEYGFKNSPMSEKDYLEPASYYAVTKSSQTLLCSYFSKENRKPIITLRPFSVYGPYEEGSRFIPTLMKSLLFNLKMDLVSPSITRDWIYVDDMIQVYLMTSTLQKFSGQVFNIGTGIQTSINDIVNLSMEVTTQKGKFNWGTMEQRRWDTNYWVADISKAKQLLNWYPKIDLRNGLSLTWEWFRRNNSIYNTTCGKEK
jgi:nucleoside-diphosphate-sugar epimerase